MSFYLSEWYNYANKKVAEFADKKSKIVGDSRLQSYLSKAMALKESYQDDEAEQIFEQAWKEIENDIEKMLQKEETTKAEIFGLVHNFYRSEMLDKHIENIYEEKKLLINFENEGQQAIILHIELHQQEKGFLYYIGDEIRPNIEKIMRIQQKRQKNGFLDLKKKLFIIKQQKDAFNWEKLIEENFNFEVLVQEIYDILNNNSNLKQWIQNSISQCKEWLKDYLNQNEKGKKKFAKKQRLKELVNKIAVECNCFDIGITESFQDAIINISEKQKVFQSSVDQEFPDFLKHYIIEINSQIPKYFYYQKSNMKSDNITFRFFKIQQQSHNITRQSQKTMKPWINLQIKYGLQYSLKNQKQYRINQEFSNDYNFQSYLAYLLGENKYQQINDSSTSCKAAKDYFFQRLNLYEICKEIEIIVLKNYKCDGEVNQNDTIENLLKDIKNDNKREVQKKFCELKQKLVQNTARCVKQLIIQIDEELEPFCLKISEYGSQILHLVAQTYINAIAIQLQIIKRNNPLDIQRQSKEVQKQMFIAKLTSNDSAKDRALACKTAKNICDFFEDKIKKDIKQNFQSIIVSQKPHFQKLNLVRRIEEKAQGLASRNNNDFGHLQRVYQNGFTDSDNESQKSSDDERNERQSDEPQNIKKRKTNLNNTESSDSETPDNDSIMEDLQKDLNVSLEEVVEFYIDPKNLLVKKFNQQWKELVPEQIQKSRKLFLTEKESILNQIRQFFIQLINELRHKPLLDSQSIFLPKKNLDVLNQKNIDGNSIFGRSQIKETVVLKNIFQKACTNYLIKMIQNNWKSDEILLIDGQEIVCHPRISLPLPEDLKIHLNNEIRQSFVDILSSEQISRLDLFSDEFLVKMNLNFQKVDPPTDDEFIGELLQDFKNEFIGCEEHCPLCRRQCDYPHKESEPLAERIHQCLEGHQIQGFGGNKHFGTNKALTKSCSELRDSDEVFYQQNTIKWSTFKLKFKNWKFDGPSQGALSIVKEKNIKIWNYLGPKICQEYQNKKNLNIKFVKAQKLMICTVHYILLLDTSGSMQGKQWQDLINAVTKFLKTFDQNMNLKQFSRISIFTYNDQVQQICVKQIPESGLADKIKYLSGGTDFTQPLIRAKNTIEQTFKKFDKFVLCFLSDGCAGYPDKIIKEFQQNKKIMDKLDFTGIGFGHEQIFRNVLGRMAEQLNGKMKITIEPEELSNMFVKLIPNLYEE